MQDLNGPRILLTDTNRWTVTPRLAIAFSRAGCRVAALCPMPGHPILKTSAVQQTFPYNGFRPVESLREAINEFSPDIVVPACDRGVQHLHELHAFERSRGGDSNGIVSLIERSLGDAASFQVVSSRFELLKTAKMEGIPVPSVFATDDFSNLVINGSQCIIIKADGTWGGKGVRLAHSAKDAEHTFEKLGQRPGYFELAKRMLLNRDRDWEFFDWKHSKRPVIAQRFIVGRPANCAVACWKGKVLAGISVEVVLAQGARGPAIVVQVVDGRAMMCAAEKLAWRLNLSGFFGLDFMIEEPSGETYLVEMNPRCTPPCPLPLGRGRDLVAAMVAQLTGNPIVEREPATDKRKIAYFPQGCGVSNLDIVTPVDGYYLDEPVGEQTLIDELMHPWSERSVLGRLVDLGRAFLKKQPENIACEFLRPGSSVRSDRPAEIPF
jgi:ATP-grasp domain